MKKIIISLIVLSILGLSWILFKRVSITDTTKLVGKYQFGSGQTMYIAEYNDEIVLYKQVDKIKSNNSLQYTYFDGKMFEIQKGFNHIKCEEGVTKLYEKCLVDGNEYTRVLFDSEIGKTYKINPIMSEQQVKQLAKNSVFPFSGGQTKLVDLEKLDTSLKIDIRYATDNNFMGFTLYPDNKAFLEESVANSLVKANQELRKIGLGIVVYDAYRPWYVTKMFWEATPDDKKDFVADPSKGSRHNRGYAVDIGLYDLNSGKYLEMPSGFDEFSERAYPEYIGGTTMVRNHRNILIKYMTEQGFVVNGGEWWHYDYTGRQNAPVLNLDFSQIN